MPIKLVRVEEADRITEAGGRVLDWVRDGAELKARVQIADPGFYYSIRNQILNPAFDVWQRGVTFPTGGYFADRFNTSFRTSDGGAGSMSRETFTLGNTGLPGNPGDATYFARVNFTTNPSTNADMRVSQEVENVRTFAGEDVTFSTWARSDGSNTFQTVIWQNFGVGGSTSVRINLDHLHVTPAWHRFQFTTRLPDLSGQTIGTGSYLSVQIRQLNGGLGQLDLYGWQLEKGTVASEFDRRSIQVELPILQRYYQKTFPIDTDPADNAGIAGALVYGAHTAGVSDHYVNHGLAVPMRATPSVVFYNPGSGASSVWRNLTRAQDSAAAVLDDTSGDRNVTVKNPQIAGDQVSHRIAVHATFDAEIR